MPTFAKPVVTIAAAVLAGLLSAPAVRAQAATLTAAPSIDAATRARELAGLIERGDRAAVRAYATTSFAPPLQPAAARLVDLVSRLHDRSHGIDHVMVEATGPNEANLTFTSRLTGERQRVVVAVDPATSRITRIAPRPAPVGASSGPTPSFADVDAFVSKLAQADLFSGVILVAKDGKPVFEKSYGLADRATGERNGLDTRFNIGSMNKAFTGIAVAQLVDAGKLSYDDPLSEFMPDFPDPESAKKIKIKHLLSHTSGLGNYFNERFAATPVSAFRGLDDYFKVAGGEPLQFEPGTGWFYSNTGMLALGRVIEIASGVDYYDYIQKHIYEPAGMTSSGSLLLDAGLPEIAKPYELDYTDAGRKVRDASDQTPVRGSSAGGGVATAQDLLRFSNALRAGKLISADTFAVMSQPKTELGSRVYGYGISKERFAPPTRDIVGHGGDAFGTCAVWGEVRDASGPYTVIILSNSAIGSCHPVATRIYEAIPPARSTDLARRVGK